MKRLLLFLLSITALCGSLSAATPLAEGRWAKVSVDTTGIFEISYDRLRELGFSDPSQVAVYGSGGVVASDHSFKGPFGSGFARTPAMHTPDGRLLFFAEGPVRGVLQSSAKITVARNYYDDKAFYYLSDSQGFTDLPQTGNTSTSATPGTTHYHIVYYDREVSSPPIGGGIFLSRLLAPGQTEDYDLPTDGFSSKNGSVSLYCEYGIRNWERAGIDFSLSDNLTPSKLTAATVARITSGNESYKRGTLTATFSPAEETDHVVATFGMPEGMDVEFCAVDFLYAIYPRLNSLATAPSLVMNYVSSAKALKLSDYPDDVELWNVSPGVAASRLTTVAGDDGTLLAVPVGTATRLVAFAPSRPQRAVGTVTGISNRSLTSSPVPDILIICAPALRDAAEELAEIHRTYQGSEVLVAPQNEVFDEFSEGSRTPMAFRRLAASLYHRNPAKLRHIILYGGASYENLLIDNEGSQLVTFQSENVDECRWICYNYCADQYFGMLDYDYNHADVIRTAMDVNVGRIPVTSPLAGRSYNAKVRRFFERGPKPAEFLRAIMYSSEGDDRQHFDQSSEAAEALESNPLMSVARVDNYFYAYDEATGTFPDLLKEASSALTRGVGYICFSGHGDHSGMSVNINTQQVDAVRYSAGPFGMFASCETFCFDRLGYNIGTYMLQRADGGALCILASARPVVLTYNRRLGTEISQAYADLRPGDTYGDLLRRARQRIITENATTSVCRNTMCYNFGGDPALPVPVAEFGIVFDGTQSTTFIPRESKTVSGYIADAAGNIVSGFNGTVELDLHKAAVEKAYVPDSVYATDSHEILTTVSAAVVNGRFKADITVPATGISSTGNIMSASAVDAMGRCAAGVSNSFAVSAEVSGDYDTTPPRIMAMYIDSDSFVSGDVVADNFVLYADVDPSPAGLRLASGLERSVKLTMDGSTSYANAAGYARSTPDGMVRFEIPFVDISAGKHTLCLSVASNNGMSTSSTIDFIVSVPQSVATLTLDTDKGVAVRGKVVFGLEGAAEGRLIVVDRAGRTVLSVPSCPFPYTWNLEGADGVRVPDGAYRAWVITGGSGVKGSTDAVQFTVLRPRPGNK